MVKKMKYEVLDKLKNDKRFLNYLRENSIWYKKLNRDSNNYFTFINVMKEKYKLRTIDKVDSFVDSVDLISKIVKMSND